MAPTGQIMQFTCNQTTVSSLTAACPRAREKVCVPPVEVKDRPFVHAKVEKGNRTKNNGKKLGPNTFTWDHHHHHYQFGWRRGREKEEVVGGKKSGQIEGFFISHSFIALLGHPSQSAPPTHKRTHNQSLSLSTLSVVQREQFPSHSLHHRNCGNEA